MSSVKPWPHITIYTGIRTGKPVLEWAPVPGATKYEIHRSMDRNGPFRRYWTQEKTSYINGVVTPGYTYYYKIVALCANPVESDIVSITVDCATPTVTVAIREDTGLPVLSWEPVEGAAKYDIYRSMSRDGSYTRFCTVPDTFHPIPMTGDGQAWYKVMALCTRSKYGNSHLSDPVYPPEHLKALFPPEQDPEQGSAPAPEEDYAASLPGGEKDYIRSVFLRYMQRHPHFNSVTTFPDYFQRELNISNSYRYVKQLIKQGFLSLSGDSVIALTEQGKAAINANHTRFFDWSTPYVSYSEYVAAYESMGAEASFWQVMKELLLQKKAEFSSAGNLDGARDVLSDIAQLYLELEEPEQALYYYLTALYYDISGYEYHPLLRAYFEEKATRKAVEAAFTGIAIRPQVISGIQSLRDIYQPDSVSKIYAQEALSMHLCPMALMLELIEDLQKGPYEYGRWKKKFFAAYQAMLADPAEDSQQNNDGAAL